MKTILVPTDFSACALNALKYAVVLAKATDSKVILFHAFAMPSNPNAGFLTGVDKLLQLETEESEHKLKEIKSHFPDTAIEPLIYRGDLLGGIKEVCVERDVDLVVLGTEGDSGTERLFFSSFTVSAIGNLQTPMLVVPDEAEPALPTVATYATEFDQDDYDAIIEAKALLAPLHLSIKALHIRKPNQPPHPMAHEFESFFANRGIELNYRTSSDPEDGILGYMNDEKPGIMILLRRKRSFFGALFSRSVTKDLAYVTHIPLLIMLEK